MEKQLNPSDETGSPAMTDTETYTLTLERTFEAPISLVFQAWTDPEHLTKWWGPEGVTISHCEMDVRPGGRYRTCMLGAEGNENWVQGEYVEIEEPTKLVMTWAWEIDGNPENLTNITTVSVLLSEPEEGKTRLILTHDGFDTTDGRDNHNGGWTSSMVCLEQHLSS